MVVAGGGVVRVAEAESSECVETGWVAAGCEGPDGSLRPSEQGSPSVALQ